MIVCAASPVLYAAESISSVPEGVPLSQASYLCEEPVKHGDGSPGGECQAGSRSGRPGRVFRRARATFSGLCSTPTALVSGEDLLRIGRASEAINGSLCVLVCEQHSVLAGSRSPFCLVPSSQDEM